MLKLLSKLSFQNELIFFIYVIFVSTFSLIALKISKSTLISLICLQVVLSNLFISKEITLFGLSATASDALYVGATLSLNLLQEFFNKQEARKAIWISFFSSIFYTVAVLLHLSYNASGNMAISNCFNSILSPMPRIIIASLFTYLLVQHIDSYLYSKFTQKFKNKFFLIRNYSSVAISQLLDTIMFSFLGLYGLSKSYSNIYTIIQIIIISYIVKILVITISAPFLTLSKKIINKKI